MSELFAIETIQKILFKYPANKSEKSNEELVV